MRGSRRVLLATVSLLALTSGASAQSWSGFYVGITAGGAWNNAKFTDLGSPGSGNFFPPGTTFWTPSAGGITIGGQAGYNWQVGNFVYGLEADLSFVDASSSATFFGSTTTTRLDRFGTVRGRIGFVAIPALLIYATGGLAVGHVRNTWDGGGLTLNDSTRVGWTFGGGIEYMLTPNWTFRLESLFADLGSQTVDGGPGVGGPYRTRFANSVSIARGGFSFKW